MWEIRTLLTELAASKTDLAKSKENFEGRVRSDLFKIWRITYGSDVAKGRGRARCNLDGKILREKARMQGEPAMNEAAHRAAQGQFERQGKK